MEGSGFQWIVEIWVLITELGSAQWPVKRIGGDLLCC